MDFIEAILNLIFPPKCGICHKIGEGYICQKCLYELEKNIYINTNKNIFYLFNYRDIIRNKIIDFKFNDKPYLYHMFCEIFVKNKFGCDFVKNYDIIMPVPMHKIKKMKRGYNQSELFAKGISKMLEIPIGIDSLIKCKNTLMQSSLGKNDRTKNVKNAYKVERLEKIKNKNVLLVDDIYTTGATIKECKKVLQQANVKNVGVLIIAKD